jgi:multidrug transporter EmrE-like cation transporter
VLSLAGCRTPVVGGDEMNAFRMAGIVLIVAGVLGLVYGSFSYTRETHEAKLGPIELSVKERETVNVPVWAGVGAIVIGGVILLLGSKKS